MQGGHPDGLNSRLKEKLKCPTTPQRSGIRKRKQSDPPQIPEPQEHADGFLNQLRFVVVTFVPMLGSGWLVVD